MNRNEKIRYAKLCKESEDQWSFALGYAQGQISDSDPHLRGPVVEYVAVSQMAKIAKENDRAVRVFHGWEIIDQNSVMTESHEGKLIADTAVTDRDETCLILRPNVEKDVLSREEPPLVVVHYDKIWRMEITWEENDEGE